MDRRRLILSALLAGTTVLAPIMTVTPAHAIFGGIVYDPSNYVQNLHTAIRSLQQVRNQVSQLRNEAQMLVGQAKDLTRLDFNVRQELMRVLSEMTRLNAQADNLAYNVQRLKRELRATFPEDYARLSKEQTTQVAEQQWRVTRDSYHSAMVMQAGLAESLAGDQQTLSSLVSESQGATGNLAATQSTNQLLALLIKQNTAYQQTMIAGQRADAISNARLIAIEQESRQRRQKFLGSKNVYGGSR